jgi:hypothetical protein
MNIPRVSELYFTVYVKLDRVHPAISCRSNRPSIQEDGSKYLSQLLRHQWFAVGLRKLQKEVKFPRRKATLWAGAQRTRGRTSRGH